MDGCFRCFTRRRVRRRSPSIRERTSQRWHFIQISSASAWPSWTRLVGWFPGELWCPKSNNESMLTQECEGQLFGYYSYEMIAATGEVWADQVLRVLTSSNSAITWLHGELWCGKDIVSLMKKRVMDCRSWELSENFSFWMQIGNSSVHQGCERWTCWIGRFSARARGILFLVERFTST